MGKRITSKQRNIIIKSLASGDTRRQAGRKANASKDTAQALSTVADKIKKSVAEKIENEIVDEIKQNVQELDRIIKQGLSSMTPDVINGAPVQVKSMLVGTMIDKRQLLTGGATENISDVTGKKPKLIDYITKRESANNNSNTTIINLIEKEKRETPSKSSAKFKIA